MIIAGGLGPAVTEAGCDLVGLAADRDTAVALLRSSDIDLALVDLRLMDGWTGLDVARAAGEAGVAVLFTTANADMLPSDLDGSLGLIEKPYTMTGVRAAIDFLRERFAGNLSETPPRCLKLRAPRPGPRGNRMGVGAGA
ncbi:response regulator [Chelatococcus sambhunathii]|uniref:Response regulator n=2 Tax=Chelatococcus sambhunathii TaxID=363953 RepID=A0ABU1DG50_9HYPH|nr:response regulator [Chelatococcus sambhunathii]